MIVRRKKSAPNGEWESSCRQAGLYPYGLFRASESEYAKNLIVITAACGDSPWRYSSNYGYTNIWNRHRFCIVQE